MEIEHSDSILLVLFHGHMVVPVFQLSIWEHSTTATGLNQCSIDLNHLSSMVGCVQRHLLLCTYIIWRKFNKSMNLLTIHLSAICSFYLYLKNERMKVFKFFGKCLILCALRFGMRKWQNWISSLWKDVSVFKFHRSSQHVFSFGLI